MAHLQIVNIDGILLILLKRTVLNGLTQQVVKNIMDMDKKIKFSKNGNPIGNRSMKRAIMMFL